MGTSSAILQRQIAPLAEAAGDSLEFLFVEGQQTCPPANAVVARVFPSDAYYKYTSREPTRYTGLVKALQYVVSSVEEHRPDGLLGFSQGANLVTCAVAHLLKHGGHVPWSVLFCGTQFGWTQQLPDLFEAPLQARSFHVLGLLDPILPTSEALCDVWSPELRTVVKHSDGHRPFPAERVEAQKIASAIVCWIREDN